MATFSVTFTGESLADIIQQARAFLDSADAPAAPAPRKTRAAKPKEPTPPVEPQEPTPPGVEDSGDPTGALPAEPEVDRVALAEAKEKALDTLRRLYAMNDDGKKATRDLLAKYKLKKAGEVALEDAPALLKDATDAIERIDAPV